MWNARGRLLHLHHTDAVKTRIQSAGSYGREEANYCNETPQHQRVTAQWFKIEFQSSEEAVPDPKTREPSPLAGWPTQACEQLEGTCFYWHLRLPWLFHPNASTHTAKDSVRDGYRSKIFKDSYLVMNDQVHTKRYLRTGKSTLEFVVFAIILSYVRVGFSPTERFYLPRHHSPDASSNPKFS